MRKVLFLTIVLLSLCVSAQPSVKLSGGNMKKALSAINGAAAAMKSLDCRFVQTKTLKMLDDKLVSQGRMYYRRSDCLRWEYQSPYRYVFILNGKRVMLDSGKDKNVIDVRTNRLFEEIARIMMNSVTGKCLSDDSDFQVSLYEEGAFWTAELKPRKKAMRGMFVKIRLRFDRKAMVVDRVEMEDKTGDMTLIELKDIKKNGTVNVRMFQID